MSGPPFTMSKYANETDLLRDKCAWQAKEIERLSASISETRSECDALKARLDYLLNTCSSDEEVRQREYAEAAARVVKAARAIAGMGGALIRDQGQSYNLSQTSHHQELVAALKAMDTNPNPSGRFSPEASSLKGDGDTCAITSEASGPVGLGPSSENEISQVSDAEFSANVAAAVSRTDAGTVASLLRVSRPTVLRWAEGKNLAHQALRHSAVRALETVGVENAIGPQAKGPYPRCDALQVEHADKGMSAWQSMVAYRELARTLEQELRACLSQSNAGGPFTLQGQGPDALDAARYRYLRNIAGKADDEDGPMVTMGLGDAFHYLRGIELDEEMDTAMQTVLAEGTVKP